MARARATSSRTPAQSPDETRHQDLKSLLVDRAVGPGPPAGGSARTTSTQQLGCPTTRSTLTYLGTTEKALHRPLRRARDSVGRAGNSDRGTNLIVTNASPPGHLTPCRCHAVPLKPAPIGCAQTRPPTAPFRSAVRSGMLATVHQQDFSRTHGGVLAVELLRPCVKRSAKLFERR